MKSLCPHKILHLKSFQPLSFPLGALESSFSNCHLFLWQWLRHIPFSCFGFVSSPQSCPIQIVLLPKCSCCKLGSSAQNLWIQLLTNRDVFHWWKGTIVLPSPSSSSYQKKCKEFVFVWIIPLLWSFPSWHISLSLILSPYTTKCQMSIFNVHQLSTHSSLGALQPVNHRIDCWHFLFLSSSKHKNMGEKC